MLPELPILLQRNLQQFRLLHKPPKYRIAALNLLLNFWHSTGQLAHLVVHVAQTDKRHVGHYLLFQACFDTTRPASMNRLKEVFFNAFDVVMEAGVDHTRVYMAVSTHAHFRLQGSLVLLPGTLIRLLLAIRKPMSGSSNFRFPDLVQDRSLGVVADVLGVLVEGSVEVVEEGKGFG